MRYAIDEDNIFTQSSVVSQIYQDYPQYGSKNRKKMSRLRKAQQPENYQGDNNSGLSQFGTSGEQEHVATLFVEVMPNTEESKRTCPGDL